MFIRFFDSDDNVVFWAAVALLTLPIWGSVILLLQGVATVSAWLSQNTQLFHMIVYIIMAIIVAISTICVLAFAKKRSKLKKRILFCMISCAATAVVIYNLTVCMNTYSFMTNIHGGLLDGIKFILWLTGCFISVIVIVVVHVLAISLSTSSIQEDDDNVVPFMFSLIPCIEIIAFYVLNIRF